MVNVCKCFSSTFSNQLITSAVFFHSLSFSFSYKQMLILSNINLLILPISFLAGFIKLAVECLTKFFLVVFEGYKTITCAVNFYSIKYISSFYVLYAFFVYNILDPFGCFFICCSYCIVQEVIVLIFS